MASLRQGSSPSPSCTVPITYPSSVKDKKSLARARNLASYISAKSAEPGYVEGSTKKITNPPLTQTLLSRSDPNHLTCATFEFAAKSSAVSGFLVGNGSDHICMSIMSMRRVLFPWSTLQQMGTWVLTLTTLWVFNLLPKAWSVKAGIMPKIRCPLVRVMKSLKIADEGSGATPST